MPQARSSSLPFLRTAGTAAALGAACFVSTESRAEERAEPVRAGMSYVSDVMTAVAGGSSGEPAWLGRADLFVEVDGAGIGWDGATLFLDVLYTHGPDFSGEHVGDAQVVSNVQGDGILRPFDLWAAFPLGPEGLSAKVGMVDLNTEFDIQEVGAFFLNSSHGIGIDFSQSGRNGPSIFPVTATAALLHWQGERASARIGVFDAVSGDPDHPGRLHVRFPGQDGALIVAEGDLALTPDVEAQLGAWTYSDGFAPLDAPGGAQACSSGGYAQIEARLAGGEGRPLLQGWARAGKASTRVNRVGTYFGGGLLYGTDMHHVGLAVAHARQSDRAVRHFRDIEGPQARAETNIELSYRWQVADAFALQPDIQYVINPSWSAQAADALVVGLRFSAEISR